MIQAKDPINMCILQFSYIPLLTFPVNNENGNLKQIVRENIFTN